MGFGRHAILALVSVAALAQAGWVRADPPAGSYELAVGDNAQIFVPDGDDGPKCVLDGHSTKNTICADSAGVTTDATGAITGSTVLEFSFPGLFDANLPGTLVGQLGGSTRAPSARLLLSAAGTGNFHNPEQTAAAQATGTFSCKNPTPHTDEYSCRGRIKLCLTQARRSCASTTAQLALHALGGSWVLDLDVATEATCAVTGGATTTLPNAATESLDVSGRYAANPDSAKLVLLPSAPSKDKLALTRLEIAGGDILAGQLKFVGRGGQGDGRDHTALNTASVSTCSVYGKRSQAASERSAKRPELSRRAVSRSSESSPQLT